MTVNGHFRAEPPADERNKPGASIINCVAASGVNIARAADDAKTPSTDAEVLALRAATGDLIGGEDLIDLQKGISKRYGYATTIDDQWLTIAEGLAGDRWFVCLGWYAQLPARNRNPGQANVFHAVAFGPDTVNHAVCVDPIKKPTPDYDRMTMAEVRKFCSSGNFQSLGIREYSEVTPPTSAPNRPKGAIGYLDAVGVSLFRVVKGVAAPIMTTTKPPKPIKGNVHGYVGPAVHYKPNATLNKILSGKRKGQYVRASDGTITQ